MEKQNKGKGLAKYRPARGLFLASIVKQGKIVCVFKCAPHRRAGPRHGRRIRQGGRRATMTNPSRGELVAGGSHPIRNQCDGCQARKPIEKNGCHRMGREGGYPDFMSCQASKYKNQEQKA